MIVRDKIYIDGAWVASTGSDTIAVINSTTEEVMASVPGGTREDADRAVKAARAAFPVWSATSVDERAKTLDLIKDALQARMDELATLVCQEVGMPKTLATIIQAGLPIMDFAGTAKALREASFEEEIANSLVVREPVGVVAAITPWNYPLHQVAAKVSAALGAGCTVVLKPSEVAPLTAFILADIIDDLGLPPGTFNLVSGVGPVVGEALAAHPEVDMVSFTGSTRAGKRVAELASQTVKRVALELGGKSPNVILEDANLAKAVPDGLAKCYLNSGQTCNALTRMLVPRSQLDEVESLVLEAVSTYKLGDPLAEGTRLGPLVSGAQRDRVRGFIRTGVDEGARLLTGGAEAPDDLPQGYFVRPTVFSDVTPKMTIAREEIFGPVLVIMPYDSEDEAVAMANDTNYGLAAAVWSGDQDKAKAVARQLRAGMVEVNGGGFNPAAPFGGYKQSGYGRELGKHGLDEFLEVKSMQL